MLSSWGTEFTPVSSVIDILDVIDSYNRKH